MERMKEIEGKFEELFGMSYEVGLERLRLLIRRTVSFQRFSPGGNLSMTEKDFGLVAFFACIGAGYIEELGLPKLPEPKTPSSSVVIDAEFEEKKT